MSIIVTVRSAFCQIMALSLGIFAVFLIVMMTALGGGPLSSDVALVEKSCYL